MIRAVHCPVFRPVLQSVMLASRGSTGPTPLFALRFGVGETLSAGVPVQDWEIFGDNTSQIITTVNHGLWTTGTAETFAVSGTGGELDGPGDYTDGQAGGNVTLFGDPGYAAESGTGGLIIPAFRRLSAIAGFTQATLANMLRKQSDRYGADGLGDALSGSVVDLGANWTLFLTFSWTAAAAPYIISRAGLLYGIRPISSTQIQVRTSSGNYIFVVPTMTSGQLYQLVVEGTPTSLKLWINGVPSTPQAVDAGTFSFDAVAGANAPQVIGINAVLGYASALSTADKNTTGQANATAAGLSWTTIA